jgi:hypothetical protein
MHDVIAARKIMLPAVPFATRGARGDRCAAHDAAPFQRSESCVR